MATRHITSRQPGKTRILIVDDHPIVRFGIARILNAEPGLAVCAEASGSNEAIAAAALYKPEIAVVDISLKGIDGLQLTRLLHRQHPDLRILILSMHDETTYAPKALKAGASGYVMKEEAATRLLDAVHTIRNGDVYVSAAVKQNLLNTRNGIHPANMQYGIDTLSERERQVFTCLGQGCNSRVIAERLAISIKTVETHRARIKIKLGIPQATHLMIEAARWARQEGLIPSC